MRIGVGVHAPTTSSASAGSSTCTARSDVDLRLAGIAGCASRRHQRDSAERRPCSAAGRDQQATAMHLEPDPGRPQLLEQLDGRGPRRRASRASPSRCRPARMLRRNPDAQPSSPPRAAPPPSPHSAGLRARPPERPGSGQRRRQHRHHPACVGDRRAVVRARPVEHRDVRALPDAVRARCTADDACADDHHPHEAPPSDPPPDDLVHVEAQAEPAGPERHQDHDHRSPVEQYGEHALTPPRRRAGAPAWWAWRGSPAATTTNTTRLAATPTTRPSSPVRLLEEHDPARRHHRTGRDGAEGGDLRA